MHLAELLRNQPGETLVRLLVAVGIDALDMNRLMVMTSGATITEDASDTHDLPLSTARDWIARLLDHPAAQAEFDQVMRGEPAGSATNPILKPSLDRIRDTIRRVHSERDMTAMSLAAHIYLFEHERWPGSLEELASELPRVPIDPWGDGKQTLGYVLIKGGLPDGADRPLVYSRCRSKDGLFFRTDDPEYSFYVSDGSKLPAAQQKQGGQFRDVARWALRRGSKQRRRPSRCRRQRTRGTEGWHRLNCGVLSLRMWWQRLARLPEFTMRRCAVACVLFISTFLTSIVFASEFIPDPATVQREGPAYRYPQAGWIVLHVEGKPYERGRQQGKLMWREIQNYIKCFAAQQSNKSPADGWALTRTMTDALFVRRFDPELLEEMKGIADGAAAAGAKFDGRSIDLTDIVAINVWPELLTLDDALHALPTGLEGKDFGKQASNLKVAAHNRPMQRLRRHGSRDQ